MAATNKDIDKLLTQRDEFFSLQALWKAYDDLPAVVDDDYPQMRFYYERALKDFLDACAKNGRAFPTTVGGQPNGPSKTGS